MSEADRRAFEEWLSREPSLIRAPSYDLTAELAWQAATAYATARERERCARIAEAEKCVIAGSDFARGRNVTANVIAAAIRDLSGGNADEQ